MKTTKTGAGFNSWLLRQGNESIRRAFLRVGVGTWRVDTTVDRIWDGTLSLETRNAVDNARR